MNERASQRSLIDELFATVDQESITEALGYREPYLEASTEISPPLGSPTEATPVPAEPRAAISQTGYDFVVRWETGGKAYYELVVEGRPIWPGYSSGITIGCGFDLGYHTASEFRAQWQDGLPAADLERLERTLGFKTTAPDRDSKVMRAKQLVASLADIVVTWDVAIEQFDGAKLPRLVRLLYASLDHVDRLHPHCRGALLSLVFNRGAPFTNSADRFREMRRIRALMSEGTDAAFKAIPAELRAMKRIWGNSSSLAERREGEAKLFQAGLQEMRLLEGIVVATEAAAGDAAVREQLEDLPVEQSDSVDDELLQETADDLVFEAARLSQADVRWHPDDGEQPDYGHLAGMPIGTAFAARPEDIEALLVANEFEPLAGPVVLALRGAALADGDQEDVDELQLIDQRPDHRDYRCVIGVLDPGRRRLWAYRASTVPNAKYVLNCHQQAEAGASVASLTGNILPTGCYTFTVGTHKKGKRGEIPGVLRLAQTATGASQVVVQRSLSDVVYDRQDLFVVATPADNIHPGILNSGFSSAGCLTLPGKFTGGRHTGSWHKFRVAAGIDGARDGVQRSGLLVTGLDLALAVRVRAGEADPSSLRRLRHGSRGQRVKDLQHALGLEPDAVGIFGPKTRKALCERQASTLVWADGIYAPAMDGLLGLRVYATS